jgi:hypothetical protein
MLHSLLNAHSLTGSFANVRNRFIVLWFTVCKEAQVDLSNIYVKHSTGSATHILVDYYSDISLCQTMTCWLWNPKDGPLISVGWNSSLISPVPELQMWTFSYSCGFLFRLSLSWCTILVLTGNL